MCALQIYLLAEQVRVPEDVAPGTTVARVRARDHDLGLNGAVQYTFSPLTDAQHGAVFGIKPDTGKIYVKAVGLDHEQAPVSWTILGEPKKYPNTKITISQKCANIFVLNFARLFGRELCKSVPLCAVST